MYLYMKYVCVTLLHNNFAFSFIIVFVTSDGQFNRNLNSNRILTFICVSKENK